MPKPVDFSAYNRGLFAAITEQKRYPRAARKLGLQGRVIVVVTLDRRGGLAEPPRIHTSSGHSILDEDALRAVRSAAPFPPLPSGFAGTTRQIAIPVQYRLD